MPPQAAGRTKAEQRDRTRAALIAQARSSFAAQGYARVSLAGVAAAAGVTKGALYHHFNGKDELFAAVLATAHAEIAEEVAQAAPHADPWTQLVAGCRAFLTASTEAGRQQIVLIDGPAVLGWQQWREADGATSVQQLEDVLQRLRAADELADVALEPLVHLLSGAMNEAALWLAASSERERDLDTAMEVLERLLNSMRAD